MKKLILAGVFALLAAGCVPSLNSFYAEKDLSFDPRLVGEWQTLDESAQPADWQFEKAEEKSYKLTVVQEKTKRGVFSAHLLKLGGETFLDIVPAEMAYASDQAELVGAAMFPGHLLLRVGQIEPELKLASFDFDWLTKFIDENPNAIAHHREAGGLLLTADTAALQKFVLAHLAAGELFTKGSELKRKGGTASGGGRQVTACYPLIGGK